MNKKPIVRILLAIFIGSIGLLSSRGAQAYALNGAYWSGSWPVVGYKINAASFPASVGTQQQVIDAIRKGVNHWSFESGAPITLVYQGTTSISTRAADGTNVFYYKVGNCSSPLGACMGVTQWWPATGYLTDFDVTFHSKDSTGAAVPWTTTDPPLFKRDLWGYAAHEVGHALGFSHSTYTTATMKDVANSGNTFYRFLSSDDISGAQYLYGTTTNLSASSSSVSQGTSVTVSLSYPDSGGLAFEFKASDNGTSPGYNMSTTDAVDYRVLPLNTPWLTMSSDPTQYSNISGTLNYWGNATLTWDTTGQAGRCVDFVGVVTESSYSWPNNTRHITPAVQVCVTT